MMNRHTNAKNIIEHCKLTVSVILGAERNAERNIIWKTFVNYWPAYKRENQKLKINLFQAV